MKGLLVLGLVIALIWLPIATARRRPRDLVVGMILAASAYWLFILFIAPRIPE